MTSEEDAGRIDVHHHLIPPPFVKVMAEHGIREVAGAPLPAWRPQDSIAVMDANRISTAVLSLSAPGVHFGGGNKQASELARRCNEYAADIVQRHPRRFGSFAVLPMPFTEEACAEAAYALDLLGAAGVVLLGSTDGFFLGDGRFNELMAELDRRKAIVFVHPNLHPTSVELKLDVPGFFVEFLCDTTRAAVNLAMSGTLSRYPNIRFILAHAGGFLPYIAWRISLANAMPRYAAAEPNGILNAIKSFYFDTALSPSPYALAALKELIDPSHLLFGSDYPFAPAPIVAVEGRSIDEGQIWDGQLRQRINRSNALRLFPQFARSEESPDICHEPWACGGARQALRNGMHGLTVRIVEKIRNR